MSPRTFEMKPAVRDAVPLIVSLVGPSSSGKTFSALRIASGMQSVIGGDIGVIDTESKRALHYADAFTFKHCPLDAPFSPLDYLAAIEYAKSQGVTTLVIDSLSHEHEGPGGVLEWHETELDRMAGNDYGKRNKMTFSAWQKPKAARTRLVNTVLQLGINLVVCFRAKEKLKIQPGKQPVDLGWMPIAGNEWMYEATVQALLYPASGGVPEWNPDRPGSKQIVKLPSQFQSLFAENRPLDEAHGNAMAEWARGDTSRDTAGEPPGKAITPAQQKRLFTILSATAERLGLPKDAIEKWLRAEYAAIGVESTKQLTDPPYTGLCERMEALTLSDLTDTPDAA